MESWKPSKASPVHVPLPLRHPNWDMGHLVGIVDDYRVDGPTVDCGENGVFSFLSFLPFFLAFFPLGFNYLPHGRGISFVFRCTPCLQIQDNVYHTDIL